MILLIFHSMMGDVFFKLKHLNPKVSATTTEVLSALEEPIQINLKKDEQTSIRKKTDKRQVFELRPQAEYSLTGLVVAQNTNFFLRDVLRSDFDEICIMDFGIVWGEIATKKYVQDNLHFKSVKTLGFARQLQFKARNFYTLPHSWNYIYTHVGHTHIIPASSNITKALMKVKKYDIVKLEGYLVDIYKENGKIIALTSLSRSDKDSTSRGYGACEDMYVTQIQFNGKIYR